MRTSARMVMLIASASGKYMNERETMSQRRLRSKIEKHVKRERDFLERRRFAILKRSDRLWFPWLRKKGRTQTITV